MKAALPLGFLRTVGRFRSVILLAGLALACRAPTQAPPSDLPQPFTPAETRTLKSFGAAGDGQRDDTAALQRALEQSDRYCLDGQGASYRVVGTLRASNDLCLRNATLRQAMVPTDTSGLISRRCPATQDTEAVIDCGDAAIPRERLDEVGRSISVRTLLIRGADEGRKLRVFLDRVTVDRGRYPQGGSRTDSAGIWLDGAEQVDFRGVEIYGAGKGFGLIITRSSNVTLDDLFVHDLIWAPYEGDAKLNEAEVATIGWNAVPIREYRNWGGQAGKPKFYGVRVQEQLTCVGLFDVVRVRIRNARIARCMARFEGRYLPWQTDGLGIGGSSRDILIANSSIDSTWEGVDVVGGGTGIDNLTIDGLTVSNSFGFGVKLGYRLRRSSLSRLTITNSGLAGIVAHGSVDDMSILGARIVGIGVIESGSALVSPWPHATLAGVRIDEATHGVPQNVILRDISITQRAAVRPYQFGLLNNGGKNVLIDRLQATGFSVEQRRINPTTL